MQKSIDYWDSPWLGLCVEDFENSDLESRGSVKDARQQRAYRAYRLHIVNVWEYGRYRTHAGAPRWDVDGDNMKGAEY